MTQKLIEISKKWFKQVMNINEDVDISFNRDPSGMQTMLIANTSDRIKHERCMI